MLIFVLRQLREHPIPSPNWTKKKKEAQTWIDTRTHLTKSPRTQADSVRSVSNAAAMA